MQPSNSEQLIRYIELAGEGRNVDAKGPMEWDSAEGSAGLTKDLVALNNTRDGGVIVIGKAEPQPGKFDFHGVSESQAATFDTTKVATWINNRFAPPIEIVCHRQEYQGRLYIVITVAEFSDIPAICTKAYQKGNKTLLSQGAIYMRTANAESAPLQSVDDLRSIIGMATIKRADQMMTTFSNLLKGRPLLAEKSHEESYKDEIDSIRRSLTAGRETEYKLGAWTFLFHPTIHKEERWDDASTLEKLIDRAAVRIRDEFPPVRRGIHVREWGICNDQYPETYGLSKSGLFLCTKIYPENTDKFRPMWQPAPDLQAGQWIEFEMNLFQVIEFFMFMARFVENFEPGAEITYELLADGLQGRQLVFYNWWRYRLDPSQVCRAPYYRKKKTFRVETLKTEWEEECAKALKNFFECFPGRKIKLEVLREWIERFQKRDFGQ